MKSKYLFLLILIGTALAAVSQPLTPGYLEKLNKTLPHQFKEIRTGATIEVVREKDAVRLYILVDDIEQYEQVLIERSDELGNNFSQCKLIQVTGGKYPKNYVELVDRYPLSPKMTNLYRIKTITSEGIIRMYAPVPITIPLVIAKK